jgi:chorismate dehydratase
VKSEESHRTPAASPIAVTSPAVARIPYLNAEPFYAAWDALPGVSTNLVPRRLGQDAREGSVDAGLMAVVDFFSLADEFERVGNLAVACHGRVDSVLLLASTPLANLHGGRILLTTESSTSVELCRLLLEKRHGLGDLRYERRALDAERDPPSGEAWLVIGDAALAARHSHPELIALDLGESWSEWTGRPFVYAVWAARRDLPAENRESLAGFLERSLALGEVGLAGIAGHYAQQHDGKLGSAEFLTEYLHRFTYRLGPAEEEGLHHFEELLKENTRERR